MSRLIIETKNYKGVPLCEYYLEGVKAKKVVFVQHGFQSSKENGGDYLALTLARKGYKVVSIDAYKHGERIEEPYITDVDAVRYAEIFHVVDHTATDIIMLFDEVYSKEFDMFDLIGVSMGGFIAYSVALRTDKVNKLIPTITTPMLSKLARTRHNVPDIDEYQDAVKEYLPYIDTLDIHTQMDKLKYNQMLIINGEKDPIIPVDDSIKFFHELSDDKVQIQIFEEVHEVNRKMQKAIFEFIENEKVVL